MSSHLLEDMMDSFPILISNRSHEFVAIRARMTEREDRLKQTWGAVKAGRPDNAFQVHPFNSSAQRQFASRLIGLRVAFPCQTKSLSVDQLAHTLVYQST